MKHILEVSVEVKIEMDPPLFRGFISGNIQKVSIKQLSVTQMRNCLFLVHEKNSDDRISSLILLYLYCVALYLYPLIRFPLCKKI